MPKRPDRGEPKFDPHERVNIPLDFETAVAGLLAVDPRSDPVAEEVAEPPGDEVDEKADDRARERSSSD